MYSNLSILKPVRDFLVQVFGSSPRGSIRTCIESSPRKKNKLIITQVWFYDAHWDCPVSCPMHVFRVYINGDDQSNGLSSEETNFLRTIINSIVSMGCLESRWYLRWKENLLVSIWLNDKQANTLHYYHNRNIFNQELMNNLTLHS